MTIPPFPSQDLAKLVLGYLAEEQLMTAYDEFLQASPYLDAMQNEFDRIFMTSLRNILAEYRAVKIYVETCRPLSLRKKLFQCSNLLETVKFLINSVDINKLEALDKFNNVDKHQITNSFKSNGCTKCSSLKLLSCVCMIKHSYGAGCSDENPHCVATSLTDLPGTQLLRRKGGQSIEKSTNLSGSVQNNSIHSTNVSMEMQSNNKEPNSSNNSTLLGNTNKDSLSVASLNSTVKEIDLLMESKQKIEEFNSILSKVCQNNKDGDVAIQEKTSSKISTDGSFQEFALGVTAGNNNGDSQVPAYSAPETSNLQVAVNRDPVNIKNAQEVDKRELFFKVEPKRKSQKRNSQVQPVLQPKPLEQKIKIISNVKVDSLYQNKEKINKIALNNATSTPVQVQTIFINGKPAYRTHPTSANLQNFTKDEILAMPTIIALPVSSQTSISSCAPAITTTSQIGITADKTDEADDCLGPLVIDVPASPLKEDKITTIELSNSSDLIKTVDVKNNPQKNPSVPKDSHLSNLVDTNTPLVLPVARKSSSTPRRTSHIRVLDFGTPRPETINEKIVHHNTNTHVEVFISRQSTTVGFDSVFSSVSNTEESSSVIPEKIKAIEDSKGQNVFTKKPKTKSFDWDADLRAMARINDTEIMQKPKNRTVKKKKSRKSKNNEVEEIDNVKPKTKRSRKKEKSEKEEIDLEEEVVIVQTDVPTVKPTINIKSGNDWIQPSKIVNKKDDDKKAKENDEECADTPETERLTLQNVVGAKLNISELLETPYKQAFYDIQMETPRCLVPDLPGEPMSDLKIMNIPTPRFFDSPKIVHLTPSSYSSRPTDYSSGGSYYKPDDQDFLIIRDLDFPIVSPKEEISKERPKESLDEGPKSSRPVRQCAKNVSYYRNSRIKESDDKSDASSPNSETLTTKNAVDDKAVKSAKSEKNTKVEELNKSDVKKRNSKRKSPIVKEKSRSFMKIKPRVRTPSKENLRRTRKSSAHNNTPKTQRKIKERNTNATITPCVPTKSRRKSSTPRKLHCSKSFNSESLEQDSPKDVKETKTESCASNSTHTQDSDADQLALRWSDDGSQDIKTVQELGSTNEIEDLSKIQEYIKTTDKQSDTQIGTLQIDLIKRGFDAETAKIIERDLLDTPPRNNGNADEFTKSSLSISNGDNNVVEKSLKADSTITDKAATDQSLEENESEVELSISECNEDSNNFFVCEYIQSNKKTNSSPITLKESFSMEICVDDDMTIRLRATPFTVLFDWDLNDEQTYYNSKETEDAVNSIANMSKLYTPLKDSVKAKCFEIFDSTLTSLDTPLKVSSPKKTDHEVTVSEILVERDKTDSKDKTETKKRKRPQSNSIEEPAESKKTKPDPQYLLSSASIQNIDIESVLQKLHGS